ncbi:hypothetical protein J3F83DRAFT_699174 [Trichoderma novae-zelandiae]
MSVFFPLPHTHTHTHTHTIHAMPRRGPELSPTLRARICELSSIGYGYKRIHKIHPEVALSTIKYTIAKEAVRDDNHSLPRPGVPRKLTEEQRDLIYDTVTHINPNVTNQELLDLVDHVIKTRSLQMLLREMGK